MANYVSFAVINSPSLVCQNMLTAMMQYLISQYEGGGVTVTSIFSTLLSPTTVFYFCFDCDRQLHNCHSDSCIFNWAILGLFFVAFWSSQTKIKLYNK